MNMTDATPFLVDRASYATIDDLVANSPYWDVHMTQAEPGPIRIDRFRAFSETLRVVRNRFSRKVVYRCTPSEGYVSFSIAGETDQSNIYFKNEVDPGQLFFMPDMKQIDGVFYPDSDIFVLSIHRSEMKKICIMADAIHLMEPVERGWIIKPPIGAGEALLSELKSLDAIQSISDVVARFPAASESILYTLAACLAPEADTLPLPPPKKRDTALRKALEYADTHLESVPSVKDLCVAADVSERTLLYAFREAMDLTPTDYLHARRMQLVKEELLSGEANNVTDTATRWGFWHLSRFASDYRRMFGELPSKTLKNMPGRA